MSEHSKLSASSNVRWLNCPGSVNACANIPNPPNEYMAEGTVAHALGEQDLNSYGLNFEPLIGTTRMQEGFEIEVTEEMIDAVNYYVGYVRDVREEEGGFPLQLEVMIELPEVNEHLFGTADAVLVVPFTRIHVFDLKYGKGKRVSAWKNKQLMEYALGVMLKEDVNECVLHVCQPRVEDGFSSYTCSKEEMQEFHDELKEGAEAALKPDAPLIAGDWCKSTFCPARFNCQALRGLAHELVGKDFAAPAVVDTLAMDHIIKVLKYEDTIKDWMAKVRDHAKELMVKGEDVPGYKVVQSLGNAKWTDEDVIKAEFEDEFGDKIFTERKLLSPAKFEKMAGKKRLGKDFRDDYTVRPEAGYKIVETEAIGEPIKLTKAQEDFK